MYFASGEAKGFSKKILSSLGNCVRFTTKMGTRMREACAQAIRNVKPCVTGQQHTQGTISTRRIREGASLLRAGSNTEILKGLICQVKALFTE